MYAELRCQGTFRCCGNGEGELFEGRIATNSKPLDKARIYMMPYSSWMVMQLRSLVASALRADEGGRAELTRDEVFVLDG